MPEPPSPRARDLGYEPSDVSVGWILTVALGGVLFVVLAATALYGLQGLYATMEVAPGPRPTALERRELEPPPPRLQPVPAQDLAAYRKREAAILDGYGWIDKQAGIARIPIEQAMRLLAERGWPQPAFGPRPPPEDAADVTLPPEWQERPVMNGGAGAPRAPREGEP